MTTDVVEVEVLIQAPADTVFGCFTDREVPASAAAGRFGPEAAGGQGAHHRPAQRLGAGGGEQFAGRGSLGGGERSGGAGAFGLDPGGQRGQDRQPFAGALVHAGLALGPVLLVRDVAGADRAAHRPREPAGLALPSTGGLRCVGSLWVGGPGAVSVTEVSSGEPASRWDFFVSYTAVDRGWAGRIASPGELVGKRSPVDTGRRRPVDPSQGVDNPRRNSMSTNVATGYYRRRVDRLRAGLDRGPERRPSSRRAAARRRRRTRYPPRHRQRREGLAAEVGPCDATAARRAYVARFGRPVGGMRWSTALAQGGQAVA